MRELLRKAKPQRLDDLIALNALYRPGPLKCGHGRRLHRAQGRASSEVKYELPQLEPILADTYGVIAYQEQVMRIASVLAGFSSASPTCCARPWARKTPRSWPSSARPSWPARATKGINEKKATKIFDLMEYFAGYGFNKSHSTAYAFLAYQTAYLKANYPRHFAAALLTIEAANTDKLALYISECRERGIAGAAARHQREPAALHRRARGRALRPDGDQGAGRRRHPARSSTCAAELGRITSLHQLCEALDLRLVNKRVLEALVKSGACDTLIPAGRAAHRSAARGCSRAVDSAIEHGSRTQRDRDQGQADLFGGGDDGERADAHPAARRPPGPRWSCSATRKMRSGSI